ncbi:MAG TPA: hypothetical protein VKZ49_01415 [Polyangiaceae bacterium]|nr:hypothetical protein [Polyangiaceae bacterium]
MKSSVDETLKREARDFRLRFSCEACAYFEPDDGGCSNGYPNQDHRSGDLERAAHVIFCKEFELY